METIKLVFVISLINLTVITGIVGIGRVVAEGKDRTNTDMPILKSNDKCLIEVDGQKYDVSSFKGQHPGGDIFLCGSDMSAVFHREHSLKYLRLMEKYRR